jgi:hypothetical protein
VARREFIPIPLLTPEQVSTFWSLVDIREAIQCWNWMGNRFRNGYGSFTIHRNRFKTHRIAYFLKTGEDPERSLVCHACDNPPCCNPAHLWSGSCLDNLLDMRSKGRAPTGDKNGSRTHPENRPRGELHHTRLRPETLKYGTDNPMAKLNAEQVLAIRSEYESGVSSPQLSLKYGVTDVCILAIVHRKTWKHI